MDLNTFSKFLTDSLLERGINISDAAVYVKKLTASLTPADMKQIEGYNSAAQLAQIADNLSVLIKRKTAPASSGTNGAETQSTDATDYESEPDTLPKAPSEPTDITLEKKTNRAENVPAAKTAEAVASLSENALRQADAGDDYTDEDIIIPRRPRKAVQELSDTISEAPTQNVDIRSMTPVSNERNFAPTQSVDIRKPKDDNSRSDEKKPEAARQTIKKVKLTEEGRVRYRQTIAKIAPLLVLGVAGVILLFIIGFSVLIAMIVAMIALLAAIAAAGGAVSLFGMIMGVILMFSGESQAGLFELGLGIVIMAFVIAFGILIYNFAVRTLPYAIKKLSEFFCVCSDNYKMYLNKKRREANRG